MVVYICLLLFLWWGLLTVFSLYSFLFYLFVCFSVVHFSVLFLKFWSNYVMCVCFVVLFDFKSYLFHFIFIFLFLLFLDSAVNCSVLALIILNIRVNQLPTVHLQAMDRITVLLIVMVNNSYNMLLLYTMLVVVVWMVIIKLWHLETLLMMKDTKFVVLNNTYK